MIDWPLAQRVGRVVAGTGPAATPTDRSAMRADFREFTREADALVRAFTGLAPGDPAPDPIVVDRGGWIGANVESFGAIVRPLEERIGRVVRSGGLARRVTAGALGVQMGILLGYLAGKVLGQYDLVLATEGAGRVFYVGPNVLEAERTFDLAPRDFRLWITLHEITHRTQFTGVPWLRERVRALIARSVEAIDIDPARIRRLVERGRDLLLAGPRAWRGANVMTLLLSPEQREVLGEMQALMTVVEGHGTFVMNRIGAERIPTYARMRETIEARRRVGGPERVFQRAIGLDMKYEQYALGERFMAQVAERAGVGALNRMWDREDNLPTLHDLRDPGTWLARVGA